MTLGWSGYTIQSLDLLQNIPDAFKLKLAEIWQKSYAELYEPVTDEVTSLQDSIEEILEMLKDGNQTLGHFRYVWMGLIMAIIVEPTIKYYQPNNPIPDQTIEKMVFWLFKAIKAVANSQTLSIETFDFDKLDMMLLISHQSRELESFQVLSEALDVYINAVRILDKKQSLDALIDILESCLEGYAVFPGSYGRRDFLNWWLLDVVPAAWNLVPPSSVYRVGSWQSEEITSSQMETLREISLGMWTILLEAQEYQQKFAFQNEIEWNIKTENDLDLGSECKAYSHCNEVIYAL